MNQLKRSQINESIEIAKKVIEHFNFFLPYYAYWSPGDWYRANKDFDEIRYCMLGWDVTDFGSGDFDNIGRILFTLRNGKLNNGKYPKEYAEKLLIDPEIQRAPAHYHRSKREDIICRNGGNILVQLTKADPSGNPSEESFRVQKDGRTLTLSPGEIIRLRPGESINIPPRTIHQFWGEEGTGFPLAGKRYTISSEISSVCDDWNDNAFLDKNIERFPSINEDEEIQTFLCHEYPASVV